MSRILTSDDEVGRAWRVASEETVTVEGDVAEQVTVDSAASAVEDFQLVSKLT